MFEEFRIIKCKPLKGYKLNLTFSDGVEGIVDVSHLVGRGVFAIWEDFEMFKKVDIDPISKTVSWAEGKIDLDPFNLRHKLSTSNTKTKH